MSGTGSPSQSEVRNSRRDTNHDLCWREEEEVEVEEIGVIRWRSGSLRPRPPSPPPWSPPGRWRSRAGRVRAEPRCPTVRALPAEVGLRDREPRPRPVILMVWSRLHLKRTSGLNRLLSCRPRLVSLSIHHSTTNLSLTTPSHILQSQHPALAGSVRK